jgi:UDPglucose 6-dehydrogenase
MAAASKQRRAAVLRGKRIAVLGVTFKPNTDDMRDAPSLVDRADAAGARRDGRAYDPQGRKQAEPLLPGVTWCESALEAADGAACARRC